MTPFETTGILGRGPVATASLLKRISKPLVIRPKGIQAMSKRRALSIQRKGGRALVAKKGVRHMAKIGRKGGRS